ncbi:MAG: hypothetical protein CVU97_00810 [Firmicutes bacterium HGW-Firmicutes-21]|nr:MAG: hypothetical protein CVU97_00810 [Firmicutes bacterium HGW-Firmicutes-21]
MGAFFEAAMIIAFGVSWPLSIFKSWKCRTTKGKSLPFLMLIFLGYAAGITSKLFADEIPVVVIFYIINFLMVGLDILLYFRNKRLDRLTESALKA